MEDSNDVDRQEDGVDPAGSGLVPEVDRTVVSVAVEANMESHANLETHNGGDENEGNNIMGSNYFAFSFVNKEREGQGPKKFKRVKSRQRKQSKSPQAQVRDKKKAQEE
ncbi:hypothetical protein Hanom_Chr16g01460331 [Helianthus anomalus]